MQTRLWTAPVFAVLVTSAPLLAQAPKVDSFPVEVRLRSINDLLSKADYIAGLIGQQETFRGLLQQIPIDSQQGLLGIDPRRPFGLYGDISLDAVEGAGVLMIPIANLDTLLGFLQAQVGIMVEKKANGTLVVPLPPGSPVESLYARLQGGYLYVAASEDQLDAKRLITAKDFFAKDDGAVLALTLRPERIPTVVRRELLAQLEENLRRLQESAETKTNPAERAGFLLGGKGSVALMRALIEEVRELHLKLFVNEKQNDISVELSVIPQPQGVLAKNLTSLELRTSRAYGITAIPNAVVRGNMNFALTDETRKLWDDLVNSIVEQIKEEAPKKDREVAEKAIETLVPTLKAGMVDVAAAVTAPNARGHYTVVAAIRVKDGQKIDAAFRDIVRLYERDTGDTQSVKIAVSRVGNFTIHQINDALPPEAGAYLGSRTIWIAFSDDLVAISVGPDNSVLRNSLTNKEIKAPVLSLDASLVGLARLVDENASPQRITRLINNTFGPVGSTG
ncbi:MAG: hypothetical protein NZ703_10620, partial [Gemmataceae bacterium]|nr:hypothetical protein [Gemmataceae bacterium]